ncbi:MAG: ATP synthase F0 subunit B [Acidobacteriota bacterium]
MLLAFSGPTIQLVPDGTLLFHLLLIIVMVAVLNATLLKPINRILEERDRQTRGRLTEAQTIMLKVDHELREYERRLREARSEGYALMERERAALAGERERQVSEVKGQIGRQVLDERQKLSKETQQAKAVLEGQARTLALDISRQILHRPVGGQETT